LGCFTTHDHIGKKSDFFLAVDFKSEAWFRASERKFENLDPELFLRKPQGCPDTEGLWDNCLVYLELGPRHDLGLYEAIYVLGIALLFWFLRKKKLHYSSFAALFCLLYAPARFTLDFLRNTDLPNSDIRWSGFTPAQYGSMLLFLAGIVLLTRMKKKGRYTYRWELEPEESDALPQPDKAEVEKEEHSPAIPDSEDS
jgi:phosphatidylglycerol:prolipoprotein diacylglycerol transferase